MIQRIEATAATLGDGMAIRRALPTRHRRLIGAWCFLDQFGPADVTQGPGLRVAPHPHIGLQTVTWLLRGEILHRDSLGSQQAIQPGAVNLMTSGRGISHSEESPALRPPALHGVQFWIALPDSARHAAPAFRHYPRVPMIERDNARITLLAGELFGERSPAHVYSELVGADVALPAGTLTTLPLRPEFEYGVIATHGEAQVIAGHSEPQSLVPGSLLYFGNGQTGLTLATRATDAGIVLVGGVPLTEPVLLWWNFVARTRGELEQACRDWNAGADYFGTVRGYDGAPLVAPVPPWAGADDAASVVRYP